MLLREARMPELIERRDELMRQVDAINREVSRRARELMEQQQRERSEWARTNPAPMNLSHA